MLTNLATDGKAMQMVQTDMLLEPLASESQPFNVDMFVKTLQIAAQRQGVSPQRYESYLRWSLRFLRFFEMRHPATLTQAEVETFLSDLAINRCLDVASQQQAEAAIRFFYQAFLKVTFGNLQFTRRPTRRGFFSRFEPQLSQTIIAQLCGTYRLAAQLALHANLRLSQVLALRLKDLDFKSSVIYFDSSEQLPFGKIKMPLSLVLELKIQSLKIQRLVMLQNDMLLRQTAQSAMQSDDIFAADELILSNQSLLESDDQYLFAQGSISGNSHRAERLTVIPLQSLLQAIRHAAKKLGVLPSCQVIVQGELITQKSMSLASQSATSKLTRTTVKSSVVNLSRTGTVKNRSLNSESQQQSLHFGDYQPASLSMHCHAI